MPMVPPPLPGSVLFACDLNAVRSAMAEGLMKQMFGDRVYVDSAGVTAQDVDSFAVAVMAEIGIDISRHKAKSLDDLADNSFDLVISLSPRAQHAAVEMTRTMACEIEYWSTQDATDVQGSRDQRMDAYRAVRDHLRQRIVERFGEPPVRADLPARARA
jgi:protein-tyrosine-phosphatase